jgi:hypothetical protein
MANYDEQKRASEQMLRQDAAAQGVAETTPHEITPQVESLAAELGGEAVRVPVVADQWGLYGWCSDGVVEKVKHDGGSILFGWTIWEWPAVLLNAEFHAVWRSPGGELADITPKPQREKTIIFVPKPEVPPDFDLLKQGPINQRRRIHVPLFDAAARLAGMKPPQRAYERRRAARVGMSVEDWLRSRHPDRLASCIDDLITTLTAFEAKKKQGKRVDVGLISADDELVRLNIRRASLISEIRGLTRGG